MPVISTTAQDLIEILEQEQTHLDSLVRLLQQEQQAITSLAIDELTASNQRKLALLTEIRSLEERRVAVVESLALEWRVASESLTLTAIADRIGTEDAGRLLRRHEQLHRSVLAAREAEAFTRSLVAGSLDLLSEALALWHQAPSSNPLYAPSGSLRSAGTGGTLLARKG